MIVREIMTDNPACCGPDTPLPEVARLMVDCNCGEIPVVDGEFGVVIGVVTDRDITCRVVASGRNPIEMTASDCMSTPVTTVAPDASVDDCCHVMEINQVRRLPVIDSRGVCCGIVSQADIARQASPRQTAHVVKDISRPTDSPSAVRLH